MSDDLSECAAGLARSMQPAWIYDPDHARICWANQPALEFWAVETRAELFARDIISSAPPAVVERIESVTARVRAGERVREEWLMYPKGVKTTVVLDFSPMRLDDGRTALLLQVQPFALDDDALESNIAMFRQAGVISALVAHEGTILSQNPAASVCFGERPRWNQWFETPSEADALLGASVTSSEAQHALLRVVPDQGTARWHMVETKVVRDPITTELATLVEHVDVTAQVEAENLAENRGQQLAALDATLAVVARQREEILALSAPLLEVGRGVLAVPLIGRFDGERSESLLAKILDYVQRKRIGQVIVDLTGLAELDTESARYLDGLVSSLALLGAQTRLSGARPAHARELAQLGIDTERLTFCRSLAEALRRD